MTEAEIQNWFEGVITSGKLIEVVTGTKEIKETIASWTGPNQVPPFSVDYLMRKKCYLSADSVLDSFDDLTIVSSNTSVSRTKGEILRPDIICFNVEKNIVVIFELKENDQTARQAMTEVLAYEHEIQNHLPFIALTDIYFVIISPEWSTLLEHSLAALNTWGNRKALGLTLKFDPGGWNLSPHIPNAWSYMRADGLAPSSLFTINLCLYPKGVINEDEPLPKLNLAREMISRKAEQIHSTGFILLWENTSPFAVAKWVITVGVIHPIAFYLHSKIYGDENRESELTKFLSDESNNHQFNPPQALHEVVADASNYLENTWDVSIENYLDWESQRKNISQMSIPIIGDFFGELYRYAPWVRSKCPLNLT